MKKRRFFDATQLERIAFMEFLIELKDIEKDTGIDLGPYPDFDLFKEWVVEERNEAGL